MQDMMKENDKMQQDEADARSEKRKDESAGVKATKGSLSPDVSSASSPKVDASSPKEI